MNWDQRLGYHSKPAMRAGSPPIEKTLAGITTGTVQHLSVLSEVRWPVLK
jgi:hypothetical protein